MARVPYVTREDLTQEFQAAYIQLPSFQELHYVSHPFHHRQSTSFTEYRNSSAGSFYVGFTLALV